MKKIDVNRMIKVILTEAGARQVNSDNRYWATKYPTVEAFKVDKIYEKGDEYETQLWSLMNMFGPSMFAGNECPFMNCAILVEDEGIEDVTVKEAE